MAEGDGPTIQSSQSGDKQDKAPPPAKTEVSPSVQREAAGVPKHSDKVTGVDLSKVELTSTKGVKADNAAAASDSARTNPSDKTSDKLASSDPSKPSEQAMQYAKQMEAARLQLAEVKAQVAQAATKLADIAHRITGNNDLQSLQANPAAAIAQVISKIKDGGLNQEMISAAREIPQVVSQYAPAIEKSMKSMESLLATTGDAKSSAEKEQPAIELARRERAVRNSSI